MNRLCPHCGAAVETDSMSAGQPSACPACGRPLLLSNLARRKVSATRPPRFRKDAVIALAIFVVLLLLWRLMTRPEEWGGVGAWARTNVFGPGGVGLAESFGLGRGSGRVPSAPGATAPNGTGGSSTVTTNPAQVVDHETRANEQSNGTNIQRSPTQMVQHEPGTNETSTETNVSSFRPEDGSNAPPISNTNVIEIADLSPPSSIPDATNIARRLGEVGAKSGDIQFSLLWKNFNDLDLHCIDPKGVEIYYSNPRSPLTGGVLDVDTNVHPPFSTMPAENIYWPTGRAPPGIYRVYVVYYANHGGSDPTAFTVRAVVQHITNYYRGALAVPDPNVRHWIWTIQYNPASLDPAQRCRFLSQPR